MSAGGGLYVSVSASRLISRWGGEAALSRLDLTQSVAVV